jgi:hypothetical protein
MRIGKILVTIYVGMSLLLLLPYLVYGETPLEIWHDPLTCVGAGTPIGISADVVSTAPLKEVRVYFKKHETTSLYFVPMKHGEGARYTGTLPAPMETGASIDYFILVVDENDNSVKSPAFSASIGKKSECSESLNLNQPEEIVVYAEKSTSPEIGFSGENVHWNVSEYAGKPYFIKAKEIHVQSYTGTSTTQGQRDSNLNKSGFSKKTVIGLGVGLGALAGAGVIMAKNLGEKEPDLIAKLVKTPQVQTACGTIVTNQLYVTNKKSESVTVGTIDYEIVLTRDNPAGSCEGGRNGTFAPNWATVVPPGATVLVREWSNEVNPCSDCPYLSAECRWNSRYIVHTSAGDTGAKSTFTVQGDLCGTSSAKSYGTGTPVKGDVEP